MLQLDSAKWSKLSHAYGSAADIPDLLKLLRVAGNNDSRRSIINDLWSALCHQGTIYSASIAAVPHITEICRENLENSLESELLLVTCIAIAWLDGQHPETDQALETSYLSSVSELPKLALEKLETTPSEEMTMIAAAIMAVSTSNSELANAYLSLQASLAPKFLDWVMQA